MTDASEGHIQFFVHLSRGRDEPPSVTGNYPDNVRVTPRVQTVVVQEREVGDQLTASHPESRAGLCHRPDLLGVGSS